MSKRIVGIVQARCSSHRLPGKVLLPLAGHAVLEHVLNAVRAATQIDDLVLATTDNSGDDPLATIARGMRIRVFRGSEEDVLERFVGAIEGMRADAVVRLTADNPLLDPRVIDMVVERYLEGDCDYASNNLKRSWPRGMDAEVISREALECSAREGTLPEHREHVTIYVRTHPERFVLASVIAPQKETWPELRLSLDTIEDYKALQYIFNNIYVKGHILSIQDVIQWLRKHPEVVAMNCKVEHTRVFGKEY